MKERFEEIKSKNSVVDVHKYLKNYLVPIIRGLNSDTIKDIDHGSRGI